MSDIKTLIERRREKKPGLLSKLAKLAGLGLAGYGAHKLGQQYSPGYREVEAGVKGGIDAFKNAPKGTSGWEAAKQGFRQSRLAQKAREGARKTGEALQDLALPESTNITQFIKHLGEKDYATADKYLEKVIQRKLYAKIAEQYKSQKLY